MWLKIRTTVPADSQSTASQTGTRTLIKITAVFFVLCLVFTLNRYFSFYASFDQGIFNQVFWNNLHGRFFQSSLSSSLSTNIVHAGEVPTVFYHRLGQHFTPALLLWLPIYALFPSPVTLTVLQVVLITAAGLVLYVLAREYVQQPLAVMITASYYAANAVIGPTLSNFHDICQIPLFMFTLLLAMEKRKWLLFWLMAIFILAVREDAGISLFAVGFYMIASKRFVRAGVATCVLSFGYMIALTNLIMPIFSADISKRFMLERFGQYANGNEASTLEIIWGMISNPWRLLVELVTPVDRTIRYLIAQWLPLAFIPLISPASWMIAGFPLLKLFLGKGESVLAITIRYALTVVPGLFYGAIIWWSQHPKTFKPKFRRLWIGCICLSLFFSFTSNPNQTFYFLIPESIQPWAHVSLLQQWNHVASMRPILAKIPQNASVSATTYIVPHLSSRREILRLPMLELVNDRRQVVKVDYVVADLWHSQQYQAAIESEKQMLRQSIQQFNQLINNREYGIIDFDKGIVLLKKATESNPQAMAAWNLYQNQLILSSSIFN